MAAITNVSVYISTQLEQLNKTKKQLFQNIDCGIELQESVACVQIAKAAVYALGKLCEQVEAQSRLELEKKVKKLQEKLDFCEQLAKFHINPQGLDPRLEKILSKIKKHALPCQMSEFAVWQANLVKCEKKLNLPTPNSSTSQSIDKAKAAINGRRLIGELRKEAFAGKQFSVKDVTPLTTSDQSICTVPKGNFKPIVVEVDTSVIPLEPVPREKMSSFLVSLQQVSEALSHQSEVEFFYAVESAAKCIEVRTADEETGSLLNKICNHLHCIQQDETPAQIDPKDRHWGTLALLSEELSTPEQRVRAAQRLQVKTLLMLLELAIERDDNEQARSLLNILEQLKLNPKDLPGDIKNAAHQLFGKLFAVHVDARKEGEALEDAYHEKFKGEFGRYAFCEAELSPSHLKIQAIREVNNDLNHWWKFFD